MSEVFGDEFQEWTDPLLVQRISAGIEQAKAGETINLGDFSQYLSD